MAKLLHFTAIWCKPCEKIKPIIEQYVVENPNVEYEQIDVDTAFNKAEEYNVMSIPTLISVDNNNKIIKRHTGIATKDQIEKLFN